MTKAMTSPQMRSARTRSALAKQQEKGLILPTDFLLTCSDSTLGSYELARLNEVADLRAQLYETVERIIDSASQALVVRWLRSIDRANLKTIIQDEGPRLDEIISRTKEQIRGGEKQGPLPSPSLFRPKLPPGQAHRTASLWYQKRNVEQGKCCVCPQPLDRNSVRYCTVHLARCRDRARERAEKARGPKP